MTAELVLAVITCVAFVALFAERALSDHSHVPPIARLILVDGLLVVAGVELVADALFLRALALVCLGALAAGAMALVVTAR